MLKRIISVILVVLMLVSLTAVAVEAKNHGKPDKNYTKPTYGHSDKYKDKKYDTGFGLGCFFGCIGTHQPGCNMYCAPAKPTCNKNCKGSHVYGCNLYCGTDYNLYCNKNCKGTHVKDCNLYKAPTCNKNCGLTHVKGCNLYCGTDYNLYCNKGCTGTSHVYGCNLYCGTNNNEYYYWHYYWDCIYTNGCVYCLSPGYNLNYPVITAIGFLEGYIVTFESNGGTEITPQTYTHGQASVEPEEPYREGYKFGGWFVDENCKIKQYEFDSRVTYGFILYAKWIKV